MSATRYIRNVLFYEGPTTQNFNPQVYVDIADTLEDKLDALRAHRSQVMKTNIEDLSIIEVARSCANFRGIQGRVKFAEAFHALRLFINIMRDGFAESPASALRFISRSQRRTKSTPRSARLARLGFGL